MKKLSGPVLAVLVLAASGCAGAGRECASGGLHAEGSKESRCARRRSVGISQTRERHEESVTEERRTEAVTEHRGVEERASVSEGAAR
jgi:hypothetical protein